MVVVMIIIVIKMLIPGEYDYEDEEDEPDRSPAVLRHGVCSNRSPHQAS